MTTYRLVVREEVFTTFYVDADTPKHAQDALWNVWGTDKQAQA